jgi:thiamine-monophosphate kinase
MRVRDLGEFGLIRRIADLLPSPDSGVVVGIGDDVAVLNAAGPDYLLATCDAQVENVHFVLGNITPYQLGKKTVAVNVSDIAAMGGTPAWALVSLVVPNDTHVEFVDELYRGMREQLQEAGAAIVGGNISNIRAEMVIDFFLLGRVARDGVVLRSGARAGDLVMVTGTLGDSRAGLEIGRRPDLEVTAASRDHVREKHFTPLPRLREGQALAATGKVHAMADVSDGLVSDLRHICRASRVGAEIRSEDLPISREAREVAGASGVDASKWALTGGEDYELLFTVAPEHALEVQGILEETIGTKAHVIGRVVDEARGIQILMPGGERVSCSDEFAGWDHFGETNSVEQSR